MTDSPSNSLRTPRRVNLPEMIADNIARGVATGLLKPGERLIETTMSEMVGTSRAPIREALKILHAQGIVTAGENPGFWVAEFDDKTIGQVLEARFSLETILLRDAISYWRKNEPEATALGAPIAKMREAAANNDLAASLEADLQFHKAIADAAHNHVVHTLWSAIARHVMIIFSLKKYRADDLMAVVHHHEKFYRFIRQQIDVGTKVDVLREELETHLLQVSRTRDI